MSNLFSVEKHIIPKVVCEETGEILKDETTLTIKTRQDVPFRSITDLKGYEGHEVNTHVSDVDTSTYVPIAKQVEMIFRNPQAFIDVLKEEKGDYDEDDEYIALDDPIEQMDVLQDLEDLQQAQVEQSEMSKSDNSAVPEATTTPEQGGGADGEDGHVGQSD